MLRVFVIVALVLGLTRVAQAVETADRIVASGHLRCAMIDEALDWNKTDLHGSLVPLEQVMCQALAVALFGDASKADVQSYHSEEEGLIGMQKGFSDIVLGVSPSTRTAKRFGVRFSRPFFEDAQGFMVHKESGVHGVADMTGYKLCFIEDTDTGPVALNDLARRGVHPVPFGFQEEGEMDAAIMDRHCQITTAYLSKMAEARSAFGQAHDFVMLPDLLSVAPVAVAVGAHDTRLAGIVDMTISALLQAESLGVGRAGAAAAGHSDDPLMQRLLGDDWSTADGLGLAHDWSRRVIAAVGNYGEVYDRTIGPGTPMNLPRGLNALWNKGGIMAPLPMQ